ITGTDTGVGKTLLTALLLAHLRGLGCEARAIKPFCAGGREDAELLQRVQGCELTLHEINPFHFAEPLAPLVAARKHGRCISLQEVLNYVRRVAKRFELRSRRTPPGSSNRRPRRTLARTGPIREHFLLTEGSRALVLPLGEGYP